MKVTISLLVAFFAMAAAAATTDDQKSSYEGYKLVRVFPTSQEQIDFVHDLEEKENVDIWGAVLTGDEKTIDVMLSPSQFSKYSRMFASRHIRFQLVIENVQELIDNEAKSMEKSRANRNSIIFRYARYNEMMNFIEETVEKNSDIATSEIIGRTEQNRALHLIRLRSGNPSKAVWIDCGIHAREWVSPSTCIYIIYALIDEFRDFNPVIMDLFAKYEFYILPSVNPDGYEFSQTTTRLWRKNRKVNAGSSCLGVDLNRNFPFMWMSGGASNDPCSDTHAGPSASSEPETKAITNFVSARAGQFESFLSIHSYGNWWLTPYGHSTTAIAPDQDLIMAAATVGVDAIKAYNGSVFVAGPSSQLLYIHSGLSPDWAYASENIRYSHVIELRPGPGTSDYFYGFMLPEDRMPLVATETYIGIKAFLHYISKL